MNVTWKKKVWLPESKGDGTIMALVDNKTLRGITVPLRCKDFLQNVFWVEHLKVKEVSIGGFDWKYKGLLNNNSEVFKMAFKNELINDFTKNAGSIQDLLNDIENANNVTNSIVTTTNQEKVVLVEFSNWWVSKPYLLSAFLLLCRIGRLYEEATAIEFINSCEKKHSNDALHIVAAKQNLLDLANGIVHQQSWHDYKKAVDVHNNSGCVRFIPVRTVTKSVKKEKVITIKNE